MTDLISRRNLLKAAGATGAAGLGVAAAITCDEQGLSICRGSEAMAAPAPASNVPRENEHSPDTDLLFFFNEQEARFVRAAVDRLIPPDEQWTGAAEAGVVTYIDRQLASAYGAGARMYLTGPWRPDAPSQQGYQLRFTPASLYRIGVEETRRHVRDGNNGREFWELGESAMDEILTGLETGSIVLPSLPSPVFFETLLANTIEGFFADPAYGGNRDMVGWRMIGFPGAYAQYLELVDVYGYEYTRPPISMADHVARHAHISAQE